VLVCNEYLLKLQKQIVAFATQIIKTEGKTVVVLVTEIVNNWHFSACRFEVVNILPQIRQLFFYFWEFTSICEFAV
jgi:hypothetical protein